MVEKSRGKRTLAAAAAWLVAASSSAGVQGQNGCLTFSDSAICTPWAGYVFRATSQYNDSRSFDAYNQKLMENSTAFIKSYGDVYGCPSWDGSSLRYRFSILCAYAVDQAGFPRNWPNSSVFSLPACKGQTNLLTPICRSTCLKARASVAALFDNPKYCTDKKLIAAKQAASRAQTLAIHDTLCANTNIDVSSNDLKCFDGTGVSLEEKTCGFFSARESSNYCKSAAGSNDTCCALASQTNVGAIAGGVTGGVVFLALCVGGFLFYRHKQGRPLPFTKSKKRNSIGTERATKGFTIYGQSPMEYNNAGNAGNTTSVYNGGIGGTMNGGNQYNQYDNRDSQFPRAMDSVYDPTNDYNFTSLARNNNSSQDFFGQQPSMPDQTMQKHHPKSILKPAKTDSPTMASSNLTMQKKRQSFIPALDDKQVQVIAPYQKQLDDELELRLGDIVIVEESFDDGWAVGRNMRGDEGCFPLACCKSLEGVEVPKTIGGRVVSLYYK